MSLLVILFVLFWQIYCLPFDLRLLINPLISSNFYYRNIFI